MFQGMVHGQSRSKEREKWRRRQRRRCWKSTVNPPRAPPPLPNRQLTKNPPQNRPLSAAGRTPVGIQKRLKATVRPCARVKWSWKAPGTVRVRLWGRAGRRRSSPRAPCRRVRRPSQRAKTGGTVLVRQPPGSQQLTRLKSSGRPAKVPVPPLRQRNKVSAHTVI